MRGGRILAQREQVFDERVEMKLFFHNRKVNSKIRYNHWTMVDGNDFKLHYKEQTLQVLEMMENVL